MTEVFEEIETATDGNASEELDLYDYAKQVIACQMEIKSIQDDVKKIKLAAKEKGVLVKEIDSAITTLKKEAKLDPQEAFLQKEVLDKLRANKDIIDSIDMII